MEQWRARLAAFLDLPPKAIGQVVGGKDKRTGLIDVALLQSLQRKGEVKDCVAEYGQVIADECHHLTAFSFEQVMRQVKAKFIVGLTATPTRKDGHHPIIFMQCGPIRFNLSAREAAGRSPFRHLVLPRPTGFRMQPEGADRRIQDAYAALVINEKRNRQIVADIIQTVREGRTPLVLTNRTDHLDRLASGLSEIQHVFILGEGGMRKGTASRGGEVGPDSRRENRPGPARNRKLYWRGFRRLETGHFVLNHAYFVARHAAAIRRTVAPDSSWKEGCPSVRLRRCTGSDACADV